MVDSLYASAMNGLDIFYLIVILYLGVMSAFNGFIDELVSLVSLILATLMSYFLAPWLENILLLYIHIQIVINILSYLCVFLALLFIMHRFLKMIFIKIDINKVVDMLLGFCAGVMKGIIIVILMIFVIDYIFPLSKQPQLFLQSKFNTTITNIIYDVQDNIMKAK